MFEMVAFLFLDILFINVFTLLSECSGSIVRVLDWGLKGC